MPEISLESLGLILVTTIVLSMMLVPVASLFAHKVGAIDIPKARSSHSAPIPRMGGLAMSLSLTIACFVFLPNDSFLIAFLSGLLVIVITGMLDDSMEISARWKIVGQIIAASLFVYLSGIKIDHIGNLLGFGNIELGGASFIFSVFCIVGGINACNLFDGLDGLAGGLTVIAAIFFGYFAWHVQDFLLLVIAVSLIGSIIGFLHYNSFPAKVFMGDSGSLMLGYVIGVLLVGLGQSSSNLSIPALAMIVTLPLLDTLLVMIRRIRHGVSPFNPDRSHLHHRLMDLGLPHPAVVAIIYIAMLCFCVLAIVLCKQPDWVVFSCLLTLGFLFLFGVHVLQQSGYRIRTLDQTRINSLRETESFKRIALRLNHSGNPFGLAIAVLFLVPSIFAPLLVLSVIKVSLLSLLSVLLLYFGWKPNSKNRSIMHGTLYLAIFALMLIYEFSILHHPSWLAIYLNVLSGLVLVWVGLQLYFSRRRQILWTSGFEILMLIVCWFIPFVVMDELNIWAPLVEAVQQACLLSIPFMLAMKINIRNYHEHRHWVSIPLFIGVALVAFRSINF